MAKTQTARSSRPSRLPTKAAAKAPAKGPSKPAPKAQAKAAPVLKNEPMPRRALGRGLSSLIPPAAASTSTGNGYRTLPIERLTPNASQPRKVFDEAELAELTHSVRTQGVLQPIIVRKLGDTYQIVAGERRWRAATRAGLREVPTIVKDLSDTHALQVALIENIQRSDLDPLEEAQAYRHLIDEHELTHEALAEAVGKNRATISNSMRLLNLPPEILQLLASGKVNAAHVRPLLVLPDTKTMVRLAEDFAGRRVSVREAETRAKQAMAELTKSTRAAKRAKKAMGGHDSVSLTHITDQLQSRLGTKVAIHVKGKKVKLEVSCPNFEVFDDVLEKIMAQ